MEGSTDRKFIVSVSMTFVDQIKAYPKIEKDITKPARLLYRSESQSPISAYEIKKSMTFFGLTIKSRILRLKCPAGNKPERLPESVMPMGIVGYICDGDGNGPVEAFYESADAVMVRLLKLEHKYTYLPWSQEVQVQESYEFKHEGPQTSEDVSFSRLDFMRLMNQRKGNMEGLQVVPKVLVLIPKGAKTLQIRDEVGLNWAPLTRNDVDEETEIVQIPLRFPLLGGMSIAFDFYYTINSGQLIKPLKVSSSPFKKLIQIPMHRMVMDVPIDYFKLTFVLPEDAVDLEYELAATKEAKVAQKKFRTYFTTSGEKEISFEFEKLTREEIEKGVAILFNYPFWGSWRKPMVIFSSLVFLVISGLYLNRLDLSFKSSKKSSQKTDLIVELKVLRSLFAKRREVLLNYEDLIAGCLNSFKNSSKSDTKLRFELDSELERIHSAIFEKIKNIPFADIQQTALNAMTLKRIYDEQIEACHKIIDEIFTFNSAGDSTDSFTNDSAESSGSFSRIHLSKSGSGDLMSSPSVKEELKFDKNKIEKFSRLALEIDQKLIEFESKFLANK